MRPFLYFFLSFCLFTIYDLRFINFRKREENLAANDDLTNTTQLATSSFFLWSVLFTKHFFVCLSICCFFVMKSSIQSC